MQSQNWPPTLQVHNNKTLPPLSNSTDDRRRKPTLSVVYSPKLSEYESGPLRPQDLREPSSDTLGPFRRWLATLILEWWLVELLSWIFSASCVAAIIGVLWNFDGQPLPKMGLGLTINGLLSIFSNLAKSAMILPTAEALGQLKWTWFRPGPNPLLDFEIVDAASRGTWGSLGLLIRSVLPRNRETKRMSLLCLGAVVIIFAFPFELFIQQLVQTPVVWLSRNPPGAVSRTIQYSIPDIYKLSPSGIRIISPDVFLQNAVMTRFFSNASVPNPQFSCPTSNCTWPPFQTLAVCSACKPLPSEYLTWGCFETPADWLNNVTLMPPLIAQYPIRTVCGYFLNSTLSSRVLMSGYALDNETSQYGEALTTRLFPLVDAINRVPYYNSSIMFQDVSNRLSDFLISITPGGAESTYQNTAPIVHECVYNWCVQTIKSNFDLGHLIETVVDTWQSPTPESFPWNVTTNSTTGAPILFRYKNDIILEPPSTDLTFGLSKDIMLETSFTMDLVIPSFLTVENATADALFKFNNANGRPRSRVMKQNMWLANGENVSEHIATIAKVLTNTIRNTQDAEGAVTQFSGTSWDSQVQVRVVWAWAVLPLCMLILSLAFLLATIRKSGKDIGHVGIWKNSALAILFHGLEHEVVMKTGQVRTLGGMRMMARDMQVRLDPD